MLVISGLAFCTQLGVGSRSRAERMAIQLLIPRPAPGRIIQKRLHGIKRGRIVVGIDNEIERLVLKVTEGIHKIWCTRRRQSSLLLSALTLLA